MEKLYLAAIEIPQGVGVIGVWFPDFPGCASAGGSVIEAVSNAREALELHIDGMLADGQSIPEPTRYEDLSIEAHIVLILVPVRVPSQTKRINITIDAGLLARIEAKTNNVSGFLAEAAREKLATLENARIVATMERAVRSGGSALDGLHRLFAEENKALARQQPPDISTIGRPG